MGAAGRDFHNFNVFFRDNPDYEVVAFATQIPGIGCRRYPPCWRYINKPEGIPVFPESELDRLHQRARRRACGVGLRQRASRIRNHKACQVLAAGADFWLMGTDGTMLKASVPVVSVCAVHTGFGKSQTSRKVVKILREAGERVVSRAPPMPYGDLAMQAVQRFASYDDLNLHKTTIEEREEYEPYIDLGAISRA